MLSSVTSTTKGFVVPLSLREWARTIAPIDISAGIWPI